MLPGAEYKDKLFLCFTIPNANNSNSAKYDAILYRPYVRYSWDRSQCHVSMRPDYQRLRAMIIEIQGNLNTYKYALIEKNINI
jgi:hypothetical protein